MEYFNDMDTRADGTTLDPWGDDTFLQQSAALNRSWGTSEAPNVPFIDSFAAMSNDSTRLAGTMTTTTAPGVSTTTGYVDASVLSNDCNPSELTGSRKSSNEVNVGTVLRKMTLWAKNFHEVSSQFLDEQKSRLDEMRDRVTQNESNIRMLKQDNDHGRRVETLESQLTMLSTRFEAQEKKLTELEARQAERSMQHESRVATLQKESGELWSTIAELKDRYQKMREYFVTRSLMSPSRSRGRVRPESRMRMDEAVREQGGNRNDAFEETSHIDY